MKIIIKYSILTLIAFCLNFEIAELLDVCHIEFSSPPSETQFVAHQEQTTRQAINNFYDHCSRMSCDITKNSQDIPHAKYIIRHTPLNKKGCGEQHTLNRNNSHSSHYCYSDPVSYYIFGLRKIII